MDASFTRSIEAVAAPAPLQSRRDLWSSRARDRDQDRDRDCDRQSQSDARSAEQTASKTSVRRVRGSIDA